MAGCRAEKAGNLNFKDTAVLEVAVFVQEMVVNGCQLLPGVTRCCQAVARCCQIAARCCQMLPGVTRFDVTAVQ